MRAAEYQEEKLIKKKGMRGRDYNVVSVNYGIGIYMKCHGGICMLRVKVFYFGSFVHLLSVRGLQTRNVFGK